MSVETSASAPLPTTTPQGKRSSVRANPASDFDVHTVLQGKGGVGKSVVASLLVQWHQTHGRPVQAFDTDPLNKTLSSVAALNATHVQLFDKDQTADIDAMDNLVEACVTAPAASVLDCGSSSFQPLMRYFVANAIPDVLAGYKRRLVLHAPVVGGQPALDTLAGLVALLQHFPAAPVVVWLNEYAGRFSIDGHAFEETRAYQDNAARIAAVIRLPVLDPATHGRDVAGMLSRGQTFKEAIDSAETRIVAKSRLFNVRRAIFEQLDAAMETL